MSPHALAHLLVGEVAGQFQVRHDRLGQVSQLDTG